ncbi:MAG: type II toxin-antitoxin system Phd/YefM family antitoxin [Candidatus Peregrinibacteria bacterium]
MIRHVSATEARKNFFALLEDAEKPGITVTITREGHPPVIVMSADEFEGWMETLEIMSDPVLMKDLQEAMNEVDTIPLEELLRRENTRSKHAIRRHPQAKSRKAIRKTAR